jgi:hypothetical protein
VGPTTGLDGCGKSRLHRNSIPGPSSPKRVAISTKLPRSPIIIIIIIIIITIIHKYIHTYIHFLDFKFENPPFLKHIFSLCLVQNKTLPWCLDFDPSPLKPAVNTTAVHVWYKEWHRDHFSSERYAFSLSAEARGFSIPVHLYVTDAVCDRRCM